MNLVPFLRMVPCILAIAFALLHALAALSHMKAASNRQQDVLLLVGALLLLTGAVLCVLCVRFDWLFALAGAALIVLAALRNGQAGGTLHPAHHLIRGSIALLLVIGFILL